MSAVSGQPSAKIRIFSINRGKCLMVEYPSLFLYPVGVRFTRPPRLPRPVPGQDGEGEADGGQVEPLPIGLDKSSPYRTAIYR